MGDAPARHPETEAERSAWVIDGERLTLRQMSEEDFLARTDLRRVEFVSGRLEVVPACSMTHQLILMFMLRRLGDFVEQRSLGMVLPAGMDIRTVAGRYRQPDIVLMLDVHADRRTERFWDGADLVVEIVSPDDPARDWVAKREEYARAGIPEYWIIDPRTSQVLVLGLDETAGAYREVADCRPGDIAESRLLAGFSIDVAELFDAADR